jgi:Protein of unknown function (DUF2442)
MIEKNFEKEKKINYTLKDMRKEINKQRELTQPVIIQEAKEYPAVSQLKCEKYQLTATLSDGRVISIPTAWFSRLRKASEAQLNNFEIAEDGYDIHWPELDEDISVKAFINGLAE